GNGEPSPGRARALTRHRLHRRDMTRRVRMRGTIFALCALMLLSAGPLWARDAASDVRQLDQQVVEAILDGNDAFIDRSLADDYTYIDSGGRFRTKADFLRDLRTGAIKFERLTVTDRRVRVYSDAALVTGRE